MYHIAIVEDEAAFAAQLQEYLEKYQEEHDVRFKISVFGDGEEILKDYQPLYDIILLDIEMPKVNGMQAAEQIREQDADVTLMFITNMAGYAIKDPVQTLKWLELSLANDIPDDYFIVNHVVDVLIQSYNGIKSFNDSSYQDTLEHAMDLMDALMKNPSNKYLIINFINKLDNE